MLATLGFGLVGLFFAVFGLTFEWMVVRPTKLHLTEFALANGVMALAFWIMAGATYLGNVSVLQVGAIMFDGLILAATVAVLDVALVLVKYREVWLVVAVAGCLYLLSDLVTSYPPIPFLKDGMLYMNDQAPVLATLAVIVAVIWLPVSILMTREVTHEIRQNHHWPLFGVVYFASTLAAVTFAFSGQMEVMIGAFGAAVVCFALLLATNLHVAKEARAHHKGLHAPAHQAQ